MTCTESYLAKSVIIQNSTPDSQATTNLSVQIKYRVDQFGVTPYEGQNR